MENDGTLQPSCGHERACGHREDKRACCLCASKDSKRACCVITDTASVLALSVVKDAANMSTRSLSLKHACCLWSQRKQARLLSLWSQRQHARLLSLWTQGKQARLGHPRGERGGAAAPSHKQSWCEAAASPVTAISASSLDHLQIIWGFVLRHSETAWGSLLEI